MSKHSIKNSEFLTRKRLIDERLKRSSWKVVRYKDDRSAGTYAAEASARYGYCAIEEYPTQNGPADYALCIGGKVLGIVEAKKLTLGPQNALTQAERYSRGVVDNLFNFRGYRVPFLYSTNGEVIWYHDIRQELNRSRQIAHFHTADALAELLQRDLEASCEKLTHTPNDHPLIRPYQKDANEETEKAIADRKCHMLLAMATGTGKTFTPVNQIYRLMEAGVAKRILFWWIAGRLQPKRCAPLPRSKRGQASSSTRSMRSTTSVSIGRTWKARSSSIPRSCRNRI